MLQRSEGYSPVFNLVLPTSLDNRPLPPQSPTDFSNDRSPETEEALRTIQQTVSANQGLLCRDTEYSPVMHV